MNTFLALLFSLWLFGATVLTNVGKAVVHNRILGGGTEPKFIAWGTGTATAVIGDTALQTEAPETTGGLRTNGTSSRVTTSTTNDTYQVVGAVTATGTRAITEAGLLDAASAGNLFIRGDFAAVNVASGDSILFTIKWQIL